MISEDKLIKQLNNLRDIKPSDGFAEKLKGIVLSTPRPQKHAWSISGLGFSAKESLGFTLSVGFVAIFIAVFIGVTPQALSPIIGSNNPATNSTDMLNQANAAVNDIDIHMAEVNAFDAVAQQSSNALSNISPSSMSQEKNNISSSTANIEDDASKIDNVLNQLSK